MHLYLFQNIKIKDEVRKSSIPLGKILKGIFNELHKKWDLYALNMKQLNLK